MPPNVSEDWHLNRLCYLLTSKGGANRHQAESNHACMNCRGAKEENKRSAVKNCRGETISGSVTAPALNRMPTALLKQSKVLRFLTLRRRGRPFSEIASAAGWADACVLMKCFRAAACGGRVNERMRIAGLRWREAAARTTLTSRIIFPKSFAERRKIAIFSRA